MKSTKNGDVGNENDENNSSHDHGDKEWDWLQRYVDVAAYR